MANIGIDARFAFGKKRGIGIYSINLIQNILNLDNIKGLCQDHQTNLCIIKNLMHLYYLIYFFRMY